MFATFSSLQIHFLKTYLHYDNNKISIMFLKLFNCGTDSKPVLAVTCTFPQLPNTMKMVSFTSRICQKQMMTETGNDYFLFSIPK